MYRSCFFFFQAEDGIRDLVRSRGLGDVYKRQGVSFLFPHLHFWSSLATIIVMSISLIGVIQSLVLSLIHI